MLKFRPDCGATSLPNLRGALVALRLTALHLKAAVSEGRLYLCLAPTNEIWLCERSIQQMKENS